ncbi:DUF4245 domain-containing protein [Nesterenkonia ebinurensis]|uniref:DUF4245 domain-containing protein n=1 Tax=Nesterenkonia ebinurensis TaxID=2608252 RepID=UPI00123E0DD8|nr:DUF4245 domain-containing protein [Nesterenkonia ebinurensis]
MSQQAPERATEQAPQSDAVQITESQAKRLRTPLMGMVITMVVLCGILAVMWFANPEPNTPYTRDEDVQEAAVWTNSVTEYSPISPEVPEGWTANYARWDTRAEHSVDVWEVGYTTAEVNFVGFAQTDEATPGWVNSETNLADPTGTTTISGLEFETREAAGRQYFVLEAENNTIDGTTVVISSDAEPEELQAGLDAIIDSIGAELPDPVGDDDAEWMEITEDPESADE